MILGGAFSVWFVAEVSYLVELYLLPQGSVYSSFDDVLWLLFAIPLLLVLSGSSDGELEWVSGLDRGQAFIFFTVISFLVFSKPQLLSFDKAYDIQNVALLLTCLLRYSAAESSLDRTFFRGVGTYLSVYSICAGVGNALTHRGWNPGSVVDLFWTIPITTFCFVTLLGGDGSPLARKQFVQERGSFARHIHDLCALGLALLSIVGSIYLVLHRLVPGLACLFLSFGNFASRTWAREQQLHRAHDLLQKMALFDSLTRLGNRLLLRQRLSAMLSRPPADGTRDALALLFIDLDRFKAINDGLGHDAGDRVLVEVANRIQSVIDVGAVACRLGGDEFVVLLDMATASEAEIVSLNLLNAIREPFWLESKLLQVSGSIGVVLAAESDDADDLLRKADQAMYRAKKLGKDRIQFFGTDLSSSVRLGYELETELRACLNEKKMEVYLQPIYSLQRSDVCGFEALARWSHPKLGVISPREFIPIAEDTGMIVDLFRQILSRACREVSNWNQSWGSRLSLSVNVSPRQFSDPDLMPGILEILAQTGLDPQLLILEITESVFLVGDSSVAQVLLEAQGHGIQVSLDDFGTGFSSLSHLLKFPTDEIKVDCTFVQGLDHDERRAELVRTVLQLGQSLKKRVIAEGVETPEELAALRRLGCQYIQGYVFSKPFPAGELWHRLNEGAFQRVASTDSPVYSVS